MWTLVSLQPARDVYWQVHKLGCSDTVRYAASHGAHLVNNVPGDTPADVIQLELTDELSGMGYDANDFRTMPCCK